MLKTPEDPLLIAPDDEETRKRLKQWIRLIKTILSTSALPDKGDATLAADIFVKNS